MMIIVIMRMKMMMMVIMKMIIDHYCHVRMITMVETCPSRHPKVRLKKTGKRVSGITSEEWVGMDSDGFVWPILGCYYEKMNMTT